MIRLRRHFVRAEDVIGVRNPSYDMDNVNHETTMAYGLIPRINLGGDGQDIAVYENASKRFIRNGLAGIR